MSRQPDILFADLQRAAAARPCDPQLADLLLQFLAQGDPPPGRPEQWDDEPDADAVQPEAQTGAGEPPADAWTLERLRQTLASPQLRTADADERRAAQHAAWEALLASPHPPPRLALGDLLIDLYRRGEGEGEAEARGQLTDFFLRLPQDAAGWGVWRGFKQIYKLAERRHDLALLGVLGYRLDVQRRFDGEVSRGTWLYMRRRAWRYLRRLGQSLPELYPRFAAQVLRHYPPGQNFSGCWIAAQIWNHDGLRGRTDQGGGYRGSPPARLDSRAFDDSWKLGAEPLLRLLEDAANDQVCAFAVRGLEQDFKDVLRDVDPRWLARIGAKPLPSLHEFAVRLLTDSPEFHQSKLAALGLHDMVLGLLYSSSRSARAYAIEYARAYAQRMPVADLLELVRRAPADARTLALTLLERHRPREIGLDALLQLVGGPVGREMALEKLRQGYTPDDVDAGRFVTLALQSARYLEALRLFYRNADRRVPAEYYCRLLEADGCPPAQRRRALDALGRYPPGSVPADWLQRALLRPELSGAVGAWLRQGKLGAADLDIDWLKGLVLRPSLRALALELLADHELVKPAQLGVGWLLALLRHSDDTLQRFAGSYLLAGFRPEAFAGITTGPARDAGVERLWRLAAGADQPATVRHFAARYLQSHHPTLVEFHDAGFAPALEHDDYAYSRVRPLLDDARADLRRFAVALAGAELLRWNRPELLYELADSRYREPRAFACERLLQLGAGEVAGTPPASADWLRPARVFRLAESRHKATRETALTLIRRHYDRVGGAERLVWLMESPEREVALFAVRLFWDRHRPSPAAPGWRPSGGDWRAPDGRFDGAAQVERFLRRTLFGLPPGRMERRSHGAAGEVAGGADAPLPDRPLPASVSKRRLIDALTGLALDDATFAVRLTPVLGEFRRSVALGESQRCIAALARIRRAHPPLADAVALPAPLSGAAVVVLRRAPSGADRG